MPAVTTAGGEKDGGGPLPVDAPAVDASSSFDPAASPDAATAPPSLGPCPGPDCAGTCAASLSGQYALRLQLDTYWVSALAESDRGTVELRLLADQDDFYADGSRGTTILRMCGLELPTIVTDEICSAHEFSIADTVWDAPTMPTFLTAASVDGFEVDDVLKVLPVKALLGISLPDFKDAWPHNVYPTDMVCPEGVGHACFLDQDGDGKPGITVQVRDDGDPFDYAAPCNGGIPFQFLALPTSVNLGGPLPQAVARADEIYLGLRVEPGGEAALGPTCGEAAGAGHAGLVETKLWGCRTPDRDCTPNDSAFVGVNLPRYQVLSSGESPPEPTPEDRPGNWPSYDMSPSGGPQLKVKRLGDLGSGIGCAEVQAASF